MVPDILFSSKGFNKFGSNPASASGTREDVWDAGGTYSFPSTADITHIRQAVDDIPMRGETVEVQGLDANYDLVTQTKALDATATTTLVALDTPLRRVFRARVLSATDAAQLVQVTNVGATTIYAQIVAGVQQTQMAIFTVPRGYTGLVTNWNVQVARITGADPLSTRFEMEFLDIDAGTSAQLKHVLVPSQGNQQSRHDFKPYLKVFEKTDIVVRATCNGAAGEVFCNFDIILLPDQTV
jgi:hypothetical protein